MRHTPSTTAIRVLIGVLAVLLVVALDWLQPSLVTRLDESVRDIFVRIMANPDPESRVAIVDLDEASLEEIGPWPWPRAKLADLVEILLGSYGAKAVGLDIVLPEAADPAGDARLAMLAAHAPVTLVQVLDYAPRNPPLRQGTLVGGEVSGRDISGFIAKGYIANHAGFAKARCVGNIGYVPDGDGVLRYMPVRTYFDQQVFQPFPDTLLACAGTHLSSPKGDKHGRWRIPYRYTINSYTVVPAAEILGERVATSLLQGRYVLVGSSSLSLGDRLSTPIEPLVAGVMVHAASLSGLLDVAEGNAHEGRFGRSIQALWLVASIVVFFICISHFPAWSNTIVLLGLAAGWLVLSFLGVALQEEFSIVGPLFAYLILVLTVIPLEWWHSQVRTRRLISTLSHYVAQPVLNEILRRGLIHSLKPKLCELTVLIADMESYTRTTSALSLDEAACLTKDFLQCLTFPVLSAGGTLDRYSGDGLVAFWGAPLDCPDQADKAVGTALRMCYEIDVFNTIREKDGLLPVRVRIGIETGMALVGDLGTSFRSTYTAVGDCINFASRLEAVARDIPTNIVIGETTNAKLLKHQTRLIGKVNLRGTGTNINVFTVELAAPSDAVHVFSPPSTKPVAIDSTRPSPSIKNTYRNHSPLLRLDCCDKPKRLAKQAEYACPSALMSIIRL